MSSFAPVRTGLLQRKHARGGTLVLDRERQSLRRRVEGQGTPFVAPPVVHDVLRSPGRPLEPATRAFMEPRLGHDFGRVRVYTGERPAESAEAVGALAYTVGENVVFGTGRYAPGWAKEGGYWHTS